MERWRTVGISVQALSDLLYCERVEGNRQGGRPARRSTSGWSGACSNLRRVSQGHATARDHCQEKDLDCEFWTGTELDEKVKRHQERLPSSFGFPWMGMRSQKSEERKWIRKRVKDKVEGLLSGSLYQNTEIELGKVKGAEEIEPFQDAVAHSLNRENQRILDELPLMQILEDMGPCLLIMGPTGSGKTTTLLELARAASNRAENDTTAKLPVLLDLSEWRPSSGSLADWIPATFSASYALLARKPVVDTWKRANCSCCLTAWEKVVGNTEWHALGRLTSSVRTVKSRSLS